MRVITGTAKGRPLETPDGLDTRPTAARVKEGIFSAIGFDIEGRRVLDLFAGSGQLGIEALSRGAAHCVFIDRNRRAVGVVERNLTATGLADHATVLCGDSLAILNSQTQPFDLVFVDPPYASGVYESCLTALTNRVAVGGYVLCESDKQTVLPDTVGAFALYRTYRYGQVLVRLYRREEEPV